MTLPTTVAAEGYQAQCAIDNALPPAFRFNFQSENLALNEKVMDLNGLRGTRSHSLELIRMGEQVVGGPLLLQPTSIELARLLPWIMGGTVTPVGTNVAAPSFTSATIGSGGTLVPATYYYKITSINAYGESTASSEHSCTAASANLEAVLVWVAAAGATGYKVYRGTATGAENVLVAVVTPGSATGYTDLGALIGAPTLKAPALIAGGTLTADAEVFYVLSALSSSGETLQSAEVNATPTSTTLSVALAWTQIAGATGYKLYRSLTTATYGATSLLATLGSGTTVAYTDTGAATVAGQPVSTSTAFSATPATVPTVNTAVTSSASYALGEVLPTRAVMVDRVMNVASYPTVAVDMAVFQASRGTALSLSLSLVGISESIGAAGTFPTLVLDILSKPFLFFDCQLTVGGTVYYVDSFNLTINNFIDKARFFNSQVLTALIATDRAVTFKTSMPQGDAFALYGAGTAGVSMVAKFSYGNQILTFTAGSLLFPHESPVVKGRGEVMLPITGTLLKSGTTSELVIALQPGP